MDISVLVIPLALLVIGLGLAGALALISPQQWVMVSVLTATMQFHLIPVLGIYPSICLLSGLGAIGALRYGSDLWRHPWFQFACALFAFQALSILWSPNLRLGARVLIYHLPFLFVALGMARLTRERPDMAMKIAKWALMIAGIEAVLVIIFRVSPAVEAAFLGSPAAAIFMSRNVVLEMQATGMMTVLDPAKAGGFFIHSNPASAFLGVCAVASWYVAGLTQSVALRWVAGLQFLAVFFTGSKAGAMTAVFIVFLMGMLSLWQSRRIDPTKVVLLCFVGALAAALTPIAYERFVDSGFTRASMDTYASREFLWKFAGEQFWSHPLGGLGFGGWEQKVPVIGRYKQLPPHNTIVILWAQSGLVAVFLGLAFAISLLSWSLRWLLRGNDTQRLAAQALFASAIWLFVQSMGENFGFFGDEHMKPILAMLAGLLGGLTQAERAKVAAPAGLAGTHVGALRSAVR